MGDSWFQGHFPPPWDFKHFSIKELLSIVLAVRRWGPVLTNQRVLFLSDNTAVVAVINRQTARDPQLICLVHQLVVACFSYNMCFCAKHIHGKISVVADFISRLQVECARLVQSCLEGQPTLIPMQWLPWRARPEYHGDFLAPSSTRRYEVNWTRVNELTASPHNVSVSKCRIKPSKLRLVFDSYKHSSGRPFNLDVLPTMTTACPYRRMVDYIKLRDTNTALFFAMLISCQFIKLLVLSTLRQSLLPPS